MPKNIVTATARAVIVAALVITGFFTLIRSTSADHSRMSQLIVKTTGITGIQIKPVKSSANDPTLSPIAAIKQAGTDDPNETGVYASIWNGVNKSSRSVVLTVDYAPSPSQAATFETQTAKNFFSPAAEKQDSKVQHFTVTGVPNATGAVLFTAKTTSAAATRTVLVLFREGRVVVLSVVGGSLAISQPQTIALAQREYQLVRGVEPHFTLLYIVHPIGYSILYFIGGLALIAFCFDGVHWIAVSKQRRAERKEALIRYHYQSRGSKVLKRRAPTKRR